MTLPKIHEFKISLKSKTKHSELITIRNSEDVARVCRKCMDTDSIDWIESMVVIGLNIANKVIGFYKVSQGGVSGTVCDPKIILQFALLSNSSLIIMCHNHPSGNLRPSHNDETLTLQIKQAVSYFDIKLLDHVILTSDGYTSFSDEGIL